MASYLRKANIIEGIGNEVVYGLGAFLGILVPMIVFVLKRQQNRNQTIHPESAANVESTRTRLRNEAGTTDRPSRARRDNNGQLTCPICLADAAFAIETNCGHVFCGHCVITYWQHGQWLGAVRCPVCRQQITLLLRNFTEGENIEDSAERRVILDQISNYNRRFSGEPRPITDYIRDLPVLLRHAYTEFFSVGGLIWMFRLRVIVCFFAALLYFISPLDIIPEAVFGLLGFLDDLFIILLLAIYITIIYRQVVQARSQRTVPSAPPPEGQGPTLGQS
ncbi:E3 ubiquitin-protein ligase RNF170-like [Haliotis cracherodii]|uniref:E3 ubiquitin-protein ligase RNF170-like n=1 Tax=Haliotis cracherodii TaxID=6455 RepID=UPI0039ED73D0